MKASLNIIKGFVLFRYNNTITSLDMKNYHTSNNFSGQWMCADLDVLYEDLQNIPRAFLHYGGQLDS